MTGLVERIETACRTNPDSRLPTLISKQDFDAYKSTLRHWNDSFPPEEGEQNTSPGFEVIMYRGDVLTWNAEYLQLEKQKLSR